MKASELYFHVMLFIRLSIKVVNIQMKAILVVCPVVLFSWSKPKSRGITIKWKDSVNSISSSFKRSKPAPQTKLNSGY